MTINFKKYILLLLLLYTVKYYSQKEQKPNIIYIYADDMGYGEIEPYGQKKIKTPHLVELAKQGMTFTQHYTSMPVCAPARAMLMTGKHGGHSYIRGNYELGGFSDSLEAGQMPLPEGTFTLPKMLKKMGYYTGMAGKWGLGMNNSTGSPSRQGFDYYISILDQKQAHNFYPTHLWENDKQLPLNNEPFFVHKVLDPKTATDDDFAAFTGKEYATDVMTNRALQFIQNHKDKPFFLYLPYTQPHVSLQAPQEYIDMYKNLFNDTPYYGQQGYAPSKYPLATYAAMITYLDDQIGKIIKMVKRLGLTGNTIIMFSSDNGTTFNGGVNPSYFNSVRGMRGLKMDVFEGGIRIPFIASWPGHISANTKTDLVSVQYDLMATFADLLGYKLENTDGISMLPTLLGRKQAARDFIYWEYPEKGGQIAIRKGKWKAVKLEVKKNGYSNVPWMLFDLEIDPTESTNIAMQYPEMLKEFEDILWREHQPAHIKEWEFIASKFSK
ncbi:arylsulfatase [Elizabethkingia miricola]|uniref:arylsulfatase n=1 Tax=Elizabethkingia miricola TaxID=172045 RepID=UPI003891C2BC